MILHHSSHCELDSARSKDSFEEFLNMRVRLDLKTSTRA